MTSPALGELAGLGDVGSGGVGGAAQPRPTTSPTPIRQQQAADGTLGGGEEGLGETEPPPQLSLTPAVITSGAPATDLAAFAPPPIDVSPSLGSPELQSSPAMAEASEGTAAPATARAHFAPSAADSEMEGEEGAAIVKMVSKSARAVGSGTRPMLDPTYGSREMRIGSRNLMRHNLTGACEMFLTGLKRAPDDELLQRGFYEGHDRMKYFDASQRPEKKRWSKWPWVPDGEEDLGPLVNEPPGVMLPTEFVRRTQTAIEVEWKAYEVRPDVLGDAIDGYHLDTAHLCPIAGNLGWARAYKGRNLRYMIRGLNIKNDLLVRVRGYNRKGGGEWSEVRRYRVEPPPPPKYVEHKDIPPLWRTMDIEDVIKDEKVEDPSPYLTSLIEKLYKCLHKNRTIIKICFRYYALVGASSSKDDDADTMSMSQFVNVANVLGLLEKGGLITSDIDRIFLRSVREGKSRLETVGAPAAAPAAEGSAPAAAPSAEKEWAKARGAVQASAAFKKNAKGNNMSQHHFVGGLVRLANARFGNFKDSGGEFSNSDFIGRLEYFITNVLAPHVNEELDLLHDAFSRMMLLQPMIACFERKKAEVEKVFKYYAAADQSLEGKRALATMNIGELAQLFDDAKLFDAKFGVRDIVNCFVRVNIEDDVYVQSEKSNTSTELVLDEFFEVLARCYHIQTSKESKKKGGGGQKSPPKLLKMQSMGLGAIKEGLEKADGEIGFKDESGYFRSFGFEDESIVEVARGVDKWLEEVFLPAANAAIKTRKTVSR